MFNTIRHRRKLLKQVEEGNHDAMDALCKLDADLAIREELEAQAVVNVIEILTTETEKRREYYLRRYPRVNI